ncbi:MAG: RloB family protein [Deferribacteraceae bacterium]|jgi:hypothetical protein|nr:RloB family protein [Deferribacteraceae bacterium]
MQAKLKEIGYKENFEAWLVADKDNWSDKQLKELYKWLQGNSNYGLALSNPKFEYWLLLHFEDGNNVKSSRDCDNRLKHYLPNYDKTIAPNKFVCGEIKKAAERAEKRDNACKGMPNAIGSAAVYKLIKRIFLAESR